MPRATAAAGCLPLHGCLLRHCEPRPPLAAWRAAHVHTNGHPRYVRVAPGQRHRHNPITAYGVHLNVCGFMMHLPFFVVWATSQTGIIGKKLAASQSSKERRKRLWKFPTPQPRPRNPRKRKFCLREKEPAMRRPRFLLVSEAIESRKRRLWSAIILCPAQAHDASPSLPFSTRAGWRAGGRAVAGVRQNSRRRKSQEKATATRLGPLPSTKHNIL